MALVRRQRHVPRERRPGCRGRQGAADRLLVETDAPYLTPVPHRKERNRPDLVVHTAAFLAEQRGITDAELDALVTANAATLFGW